MKKNHDNDQILDFLKLSVGAFRNDFKKVLKLIESIADRKQEAKSLEKQILELTRKNDLLAKKISIHETHINQLLELYPYIGEARAERPTEQAKPEQSSDNVLSEHSSDKASDSDSSGYQSVIRLSIVELRDKNKMSFKEIAEKLNAEGIKTFRNTGKKWYPQTIHRIYHRMKKQKKA